MMTTIDAHFAEITKHLYISPLEFCNLGCKICYTKKTADRLSNEQILDFVERYATTTSLQSITFCGGEVFLLPDFVELINTLASDYFIQIITNGTVDKLDAISNPNMFNLIVSLDGIEAYHDMNRGTGNWKKSTCFLKKAHSLGFHLEVFSIATKENIPQIEQFEKSLFETIGFEIPITYHPRKPMAYLSSHPISNTVGETQNFGFPDASDREALGQKRVIFPPLELGCYQISLMSNGNIYGCCEGIRTLGTVTDDPTHLLNRLRLAIGGPCLGCVEPDFMCGLKASYAT